ncbi:MAG: Holliday junction branch migration DNA helicase RuvB [bacterium]
MIEEEKVPTKEALVSAAEKNEDSVFELTLRPKKLADFIGQNSIKQNLQIFLQAAKKRKEPIEHVLLYGPPGIGKTTLAHIIAHEAGVSIRTTSGPAIERVGDLGAILTNLEEGDILFIDEIHRLNRAIEEVLYPAMEDGYLDLVIGKGPSARSVRLDLPKFTLVAATTRIGMLSSPLRDRFGVTHRLDYYEEADIAKIVERSAKILEIEIDKGGREEIAKRARKTPRIANRLLKRVRDFSQVKHQGKITEEIAKEALKQLQVDEMGLDNVDVRILKTLIDKFEGKPVGIKTLSAATSEEEDTIVDVYEPYLLQLGFLNRTPRGREATKRAYEHLGFEYKEKE